MNATAGGFIALILGLMLVRARRMWVGAPVVEQAAEPGLPAGTAEVLAVLRSSSVVLGAADLVIQASPSAYAYGIVAGSDLTHPQLRDVVRQVRRDRVIREADFELARGPLGPGRLWMRARVAPLNEDYVLLLVEDRTQEERVEQVRRDFVVNVSHELKTPVSGLSLLAEAMVEASDDPVAVARFAARMQVESQRLSALVQDIVDLSRLQVADTLHAPERISVDVVAAEALDRCRVLAAAKDIRCEFHGDPEAVVYGAENLLMTAIRNLIDNAICYSGTGTTVTISVTRHHGIIDIAVTDEGVGIPEAEQSRVFERFYRLDPARSRSTGGTGLGLAIVKHVCTNHGGEVTLWSVPNQGSTFTIRLPEAANLLVEPVTPARPISVVPRPKESFS